MLEFESEKLYIVLKQHNVYARFRLFKKILKIYELGTTQQNACCRLKIALHYIESPVGKELSIVKESLSGCLFGEETRDHNLLSDNREICR